MSQRSMRILHLYPDVLNLYGDRGNTIALQRRMQWRGIDAEIVGAGVGESADIEAADIVFIGGGQDFDQSTLLGDLGLGTAGSKAARLTAAIEDGKPVLAICGGYQLLGEYYLTHTGERYDFIGALPFHTDGAEERMIGNVVFEADALSGKPMVVGFENHSGRTYLTEGLKPLGHVKVGFGNNGEDGGEGLLYRNTIGTYSHGPLLPKNPAIADHLIRVALERAEFSTELKHLDDELETNARNGMLARLMGH